MAILATSPGQWRSQVSMMVLAGLSLFILAEIAPSLLVTLPTGEQQPQHQKVSNNRDDDVYEQFLKQVPAAKNSATGVLFSGKPFRSFTGEEKFSSVIGEARDLHANGKSDAKIGPDHDNDCDRWAVVTTISGPTEAIRTVAQLPGWCTVVVADTKTPTDLYVELEKQSAGYSNTRFEFLTIEEQKELASGNGAVAAFVDSIPYRHFARKNIGYLYAIQHGAHFIFDFDDDNILQHYTEKDVKLNNATTHPPDPLGNTTHLHNVRVPILGTTAFNHHDLMKASVPGSWARGFPLDQLKRNETTGKLGYTRDAVPMKEFAVLQYCAQGDPDIDAVHRLIKPLPMTFATDSDESTPLVVPSHAYAPYNAQASVHTKDALWATFLPFSVPGRVSDIWRGYFAEAIFHDLGLSVAFLPPQVRQDRNVHNYLADMQAELDLYFKASKLIEFLSQEWTSNADTVPERMEQLWIQLYERGYIEIEDVQAIQLWLEALVEIGYSFPKVTRKRHDNVVLMGQFNYANDADGVVFWVQKWRQAFGQVVVRGPFQEEQLQELRLRGIQVSPGKEDRGFFSPMENLMLTLQEYKNVSGIDGVLYLHDDAFLDVGLLTGNQYPFPTSNIIGSKLDGYFPLSYLDHRSINDTETLSKFSYNILPDRSIYKANGTEFTNTKKLISSLVRYWPFFKLAVDPLRAAAKDNRTSEFRLPDGSFLIPSPTQADMLFVPTALADDFSKAAQIMVDHKVFLESGLPTIVQMLQTVSNVNVDVIKLCTMWTKRRGTPQMIKACLQKDQTYGMFHPFKLSKGLQSWGKQFDELAWATTALETK